MDISVVVHSLANKRLNSQKPASLFLGKGEKSFCFCRQHPDSDACYCRQEDFTSFLPRTSLSSLNLEVKHLFYLQNWPQVSWHLAAARLGMRKRDSKYSANPNGEPLNLYAMLGMNCTRESCSVFT